MARPSMSQYGSQPPRLPILDTLFLEPFMSSPRARASRLTSFVLFGLLVAACVSPGALAQSDAGTRGLGDIGFIELRPAAPKSSTPRKKPTYRRATPAPKPATPHDATPSA